MKVAAHLMQQRRGSAMSRQSLALRHAKQCSWTKTAILPLLGSGIRDNEMNDVSWAFCYLQLRVFLMKTIKMAFAHRRLNERGWTRKVKGLQRTALPWWTHGRYALTPGVTQGCWRDGCCGEGRDHRCQACCHGELHPGLLEQAIQERSCWSWEDAEILSRRDL